METQTFRLGSADITVGIGVSWEVTRAQQTALKIFVANVGKSGPRSARKLRATWERRVRGRSGVEVLELKFVSSADDRTIGRFIVRDHGGPEATRRAEHERAAATNLERVLGSDFFSSKLVLGDFDPSLVIYRHAGDGSGGDPVTLHEAVRDMLDTHPAFPPPFINNLEKFAERVTGAYNGLTEDPRTWNGARYHGLYEDRSLPSLLIDAADRIEHSPDGSLVLEYDGSAPGKRSLIPRCSAEEVLTCLEGRAAGEPGAWTRISCTVVEVKHLEQGLAPTVLLHCKSGDITVWIKMGAKELSDSGAREGDTRDLVFKSGDLEVRTLAMSMEDVGLKSDDYLHPEEFARVRNEWGELKAVIRHNDLHSGNVLITDGLPKAIDIGDIDLDTLYADLARMEVSLWFELGHLLEISEAEFEDLYPRVLAGYQFNFEVGGLKATPFFSTIAALHRGVAAACKEYGDVERELALAYACQISLFQKYALRDRLQQVPVPTRVFSRYWLRRFRDCLSAPTHARTAATARSASPPSEPAGEPSSTPTLRELWLKAVEREGFVRERPREVIDMLERAALHRRMDSPLTDLQTAVWKACGTGSPFNSDRHVLLSAPTSSGKSTIAEMFLVVPCLLNARRRCAVYIAPTRALAQAKWRELQTAFRDVPEVLSGIVLSTGEDIRHDSRIARGRFTIACLVNEKANILFSRGRDLLQKLGCVVIDELHMLADVERGPVLELVLTKILQERRELDARVQREGRETIQVVAITTEEYPDRALVDLHSLEHLFHEGSEVEPYVFHSAHRPEPVTHCLVLASTDETDWCTIPVVEFERSEHRKLSTDRLQELDRVLMNAAADPMTLSGASQNRGDELSKRLVNFVLAQLEKYPTEYRILVFMPSKWRVEEFARRIKNKRGRLRPALNDDSDLLAKTLKDIEDRAQRDLIAQCAASGVFVHHSDIDQRARRYVEQVAEQPLVGAPSQVVVATETLSYGVNLAVDDVVLFGVEFLVSTRRGEVQTVPLSNCAFHNMLGRAGRLGKRVGSVARGARAYVMLPRDARPYEEVVARYYTSVDPLQSMLFVRDDKAAMRGFKPVEGLDPCIALTGLAATRFTNPFARSVLDVLRHHRSVPSGAAGARQPSFASVSELLEFFDNTLFATQFEAGKPKERTLFRCAVQAVLADCSRPTLGLVTERGHDPKYYVITDLGQSIIDTGTQIRTVEPLLEAVRKTWQAWAATHENERFPAELYIFCLLAQEEVYTQYARYAPECRSAYIAQPWNERMVSSNRDAVFVSLIEAMDSVGISDPMSLATRMRSYLEELESLRNTPATYDYGTADAILRLFSAMICWIGGGELEAALDLVNKYKGQVQTIRGPTIQGQMQSLRTLTEQLSWKVRFVGQLLSSASKRDAAIQFDSQDARSLISLSPRLRFGCTGESIALFWPRSSDLNRSEVSRLREAGLLPSELLSGSPTSFSAPLDAAKLNLLCNDLEGHALAQFKELSDEMTVGGFEETRASLQELWETFDAVFPEAVREFRTASAKPLSIASVARDHLSRLENDTRTVALRGARDAGSVHHPDPNYRVRLSIHSDRSALKWVFERRRGPESAWSQDHDLKILPVQFRASSAVATHDHWEDLHSLLRREEHTQTLILVPVPWFPSHKDLDVKSRKILEGRQSRRGYKTVVLTPAAFLVTVSALVRGFTSGESIGAMFVEPATDRLVDVIGVTDVLRALDSGRSLPLPGPIRDKLVEYFEVTSP